MAIDYVLDLNCIPKQALTTQGIVDRLKGAERAQAIIRLYRDGGDQRPPDEMSFEFSRSTPDGNEEVRVFSVQDLLNEAEQLKPLGGHCAGCAANVTGKPFGCVGFIQYPITSAGEAWLLDRLPVPDEPLIWLLLRQGVEDFQYDGATIQPLRQIDGVYFEDQLPAYRVLGEFTLDANQLFEMIFAVGHINPNHAALLLMFLHGIPRDMEADAIMRVTPAPPDAETRYPFAVQLDPTSDSAQDRSIQELAAFLKALYTAWRLNIRVIIDA